MTSHLWVTSGDSLWRTHCVRGQLLLSIHMAMKTRDEARKEARVRSCKLSFRFWCLFLESNSGEETKVETNCDFGCRDWAKEPPVYRQALDPCAQSTGIESTRLLPIQIRAGAYNLSSRLSFIERPPSKLAEIKVAAIASSSRLSSHLAH